MKLFKSHLILLAGIWMLGLCFLYFSYQKKINNSIVLTVETRANTIRQHIDLAISIVDKMSEQMTSNIELADKSGYEHPAVKYIQNYPEKDIYGTDGLETPKGGIPLSKASLSGKGHFPTDDIETNREINAALNLSLSISKNIADNPDFVWSYYTSKRNFVYTSPKVSIQDFHFTQNLYEKPYWKVGTPENDPDRKIAISDIYDDEYGQGLMFSISSPVYYQDEFRGVCSLDLGIKELTSSLSSGLLEGTSLLVDEHGDLAAASAEFEHGKRLDDYTTILSHTGSYVRINDKEYFVRVVVAGELYVVHEISIEDKVWKVLKNIAFPGTIYTSILLILFLIIQLKVTLNQVTKLAITDSLTGLYNRRAMEDHSKVYFAHSERMADYVTAIMMDIDHFKQINDTFGHAIGDVTIKSVANVLRRTCRKADLLGRIGGEEFLVIISANDKDNSKNIAERIRETVESEIIHGGRVSLTVSVGCVRRMPQEDFESLVQRADKALYQAKKQGRNQVVFGDHLSSNNQTV